MATTVATIETYPTTADFSPIKVLSLVGALTLRVADAYHPQAVTGTIWRYALNTDRSQWVPDGKVGEFTTKLPAVPIGSATTALDHLFMIVGAVLNFGDDPPTPYQVVVTVLQGDVELSHEVPRDGGSGSLGSSDQPFVFRFVITR